MPLRHNGGLSISAASRNCERCIEILQQNLPEPSKAFLSQGVLSANGYRRQRLLEVKDELNLPQDWIASALGALQKACRGITQAGILAQTDYFLCALLHPTFIPARHPRAAELRRRVAMPAELALCGTSGLEILRQALELHQRSVKGDPSELLLDVREGAPVEGNARPSQNPAFSGSPRSLTVSRLAISDLERVPIVAGLEPFLLFDPKAFPTRQLRRGRLGTPQEVLLATTTALCGAIELTEGTLVVASFLEHMLTRKEDACV